MVKYFKTSRKLEELKENETEIMQVERVNTKNNDNLWTV